jgi:hypothetical protein
MKKIENTYHEEVEVHDFQKGYLTLPFDENQFASFIRGLLGTPQTITKRIRGDFQLSLKDLQNFHDLLQQRISQQNNGKLIQLKTQIYYNDESSVILSSYEELVTYNEVKPVISAAVKMTWSYLIQFADKNAPEKQEIELMIVSSPSRNIIEDDDIPVFFPSYGQFHITIKHTARSWGSDIESLLTNQIESLILKSSKIKEFLRKESSRIGLLTAILFLFSSLIGVYFATMTFNKTEVIKVTNFVKNTSNLSSKTDYLLNYIAANGQNLFFLKSLLFVVISIFTAIILGVWIDLLADNKTRSYLVLTREAKKDMERLLKKSKRKYLLFWVSITISIFTSILANYIFKWMTEM